MRPLLLHASSKSSVDSVRRVLHFVFDPGSCPRAYAGLPGSGHPGLTANEERGVPRWRKKPCSPLSPKASRQVQTNRS